MNRFHRVAIALCLGLAIAMPAAAQQDDTAIATAAAVLDRMDAGDFEAATRDFNAQMSAALGAPQLAGVQAQLESAGALKSRGPAKVGMHDGHTMVVFRIQRAHAALDATVAIDGDGKVAGLHFAPAPASE